VHEQAPLAQRKGKARPLFLTHAHTHTSSGQLRCRPRGVCLVCLCLSVPGHNRAQAPIHPLSLSLSLSRTHTPSDQAGQKKKKKARTTVQETAVNNRVGASNVTGVFLSVLAPPRVISSRLSRQSSPFVLQPSPISNKPLAFLLSKRNCSMVQGHKSLTLPSHGKVSSPLLLLLFGLLMLLPHYCCLIASLLCAGHFSLWLYERSGMK